MQGVHSSNGQCTNDARNTRIDADEITWRRVCVYGSNPYISAFLLNDAVPRRLEKLVPLFLDGIHLCINTAAQYIYISIYLYIACQLTLVSVDDDEVAIAARPVTLLYRKDSIPRCHCQSVVSSV